MKKHGENHWGWIYKELSELIPGATKESIRFRYESSLNPSNQRTEFTKQEDQKLK